MYIDVRATPCHEIYTIQVASWKRIQDKDAGDGEETERQGGDGGGYVQYVCTAM